LVIVFNVFKFLIPIASTLADPVTTYISGFNFNDLIHIIYEEIDNDEIYYLFAREIIKLFENSDSNFFLCCNFMKCLGVYSNDFYNSLPDWLSDIESPVIINNNNNLIYLINIIEN